MFVTNSKHTPQSNMISIDTNKSSTELNNQSSFLLKGNLGLDSNNSNDYVAVLTDSLDLGIKPLQLRKNKFGDSPLYMHIFTLNGEDKQNFIKNLGNVEVPEKINKGLYHLVQNASGISNETKIDSENKLSSCVEVDVNTLQFQVDVLKKLNLKEAYTVWQQQIKSFPNATATKKGIITILNENGASDEDKWTPKHQLLTKIGLYNHNGETNKKTGKTYPVYWSEETVNLEKFLKFVGEEGYTTRSGIKKDDAGNRTGNAKGDVKTSQLLQLDIDDDSSNGIPLIDIITKLQDILEGQTPNFWYPSPNWSPTNHRFRIGFILDKAVDRFKHERFYEFIMNSLQKALPNLKVDKSCFDAGRLFFGCIPNSYEQVKNEVILNQDSVLSSEWLDKVSLDSSVIVDKSVRQQHKIQNKTNTVRKPGRPKKVKNQDDSQNASGISNEDLTPVGIKVNRFIYEEIYLKACGGDINRMVLHCDELKASTKIDKGAEEKWEGLNFIPDSDGKVSNSSGESFVISSYPRNENVSIEDDTDYYGLMVCTRNGKSFGMNQAYGSEVSGGTYVDYWRAVNIFDENRVQNDYDDETEYTRLVWDICQYFGVSFPNKDILGIKSEDVVINLIRNYGDDKGNVGIYIDKWSRKTTKSQNWYIFRGHNYSELCSYDVAQLLSNRLFTDHYRLYKQIGKSKVVKEFTNLLDDLSEASLPVETLFNKPYANLDYNVFLNGCFNVETKRFEPNRGQAQNKFYINRLFDSEISEDELTNAGELFKEYIWELVQGNQTYYDFLLNYAVLVSQNKQQMMGCFPVSYGESGAGKSAFYELLLYMMGTGENEYGVRSKNVTNKNDNFSLAGLEFKRFLLIDEMSEDDKHCNEILYDFYANKQRYTIKGIRQMHQHERMGFMPIQIGATNEGVRIKRSLKDGDDRRQRDIHIEARIGGFTERQKQLWALLNGDELDSNDKGCKFKVFQWLMLQDSKASLTKALLTANSQEMKNSSYEAKKQIDDVFEWFDDCLEVTGDENDTVLNTVVFQNYLDWFKAENINRESKITKATFTAKVKSYAKKYRQIEVTTGKKWDTATGKTGNFYLGVKLKTLQPLDLFETEETKTQNASGISEVEHEPTPVNVKKACEKTPTTVETKVEETVEETPTVETKVEETPTVETKVEKTQTPTVETKVEPPTKESNENRLEYQGYYYEINEKNIYSIYNANGDKIDTKVSIQSAISAKKFIKKLIE